MSEFTQGHALIIGVGEYTDKNWSAPITAIDAEAVATALKNPAIGAYPEKQVRLLQGHAATRASISSALQQLASDAKAEDTALIFFAGHGVLGTNGDYNFATHDAVFVDKKVQEGTSLSAPALLDLLRAVKTQKLLFIINACYSGHMAPASLGVPPSKDFNTSVLATGEGRAVITASRSTQYSYYMPDATHTFFGKALIDGLRGAAANGGGFIGLYELYQYLYSAVTQAALGVQRMQEPVLTLMQNVGPFPVALYPGASASSLDAPSIRQSPPSGTAVEQVPSNVVYAIGRGAIAIQGDNANINQSKLIDFGNAKIKGDVKFRDVAGGDMIKINITGAADVAKADTKQELLDLITKLQAEVAGLKDLPEGDREDAADSLRKAADAGEKDEKGRLLRNLDTAQKVMLALSGAIPVAHKLGETIGTLIQRAMAVFG